MALCTIEHKVTDGRVKFVRDLAGCPGIFTGRVTACDGLRHEGLFIRPVSRAIPQDNVITLITFSPTSLYNRPEVLRVSADAEIHDFRAVEKLTMSYDQL